MSSVSNGHSNAAYKDPQHLLLKKSICVLLVCGPAGLTCFRLQQQEWLRSICLPSLSWAQWAGQAMFFSWQRQRYKWASGNTQGLLRPRFRNGSWPLLPTCDRPKQVPWPGPKPKAEEAHSAHGQAMVRV